MVKIHCVCVCVHNYGGWEIPQPAICKLKIQECQWCNSVQVQWPKNQCSQWCTSQYEDWRRWNEMSQLGSEAGKKGVNSPFLLLLFYSDPEQTGWCSSTLGILIYFIEFTNSNANPIQKHSLIWASKLTHKLNITHTMSLFSHTIPSHVWHLDSNFLKNYLP